MWGIIPAAGRGTRMQPLGFSKELLPVGSRVASGAEHPLAVAEYLLQRMLIGGADKLCFVISPAKSDILEYFGGSYGGAEIVYAVQTEPHGLCDAIFSAAPCVENDKDILVGLPDTIWFPESAYLDIPACDLGFILFPASKPELFDAVVLDDDGDVLEIQVKRNNPDSHWIWGAIRLSSKTFLALRELWLSRQKQDEYLGTLVNEYLARGGSARGFKIGKSYSDVGTPSGYRDANRYLGQQDENTSRMVASQSEHIGADAIEGSDTVC